MTTAPAGYPQDRRRQPLWDRVDSNRLKLAAYVAVFVVSTVATGEAMLALFGGCSALFLLSQSSWVLANAWTADGLWVPLSVSAAAIGMAALSWAIVAINFSERWLVRRLGAVIVPKGELIDSKLALKDMALAAGMPVAPALYIIESSNTNALVFSARGRRPIVGVTRGLVVKLTVDEQRAVFANLVARIVSGDTIVNTGVAALMLPVHAWQGSRTAARNRRMDEEMMAGGHRTSAETPPVSGSSAQSALLLFVFGVAIAIVGSLFVAFQRRRQLRAAEKADAEGMLLLKEPRAMLAALERCVELDNVVPTAGEAFSDLFYCWAGDSRNDEHDPEWERVARLREVLGVEGMVFEAQEPLPDSLLAPVAPRVE